MSSQTILGRIQPIFKGDYDSATVYNKLDNVLYQGNTWVCQRDNVNTSPALNNSDWQLVASKGDQGNQGNTGSFGTPTAAATIVQSGGEPTVSISASGPDTEKIFHFDFGIPEGPYGFDDVSATASSLPAGSSASALASLSEVGSNRVLSFTFGIPAADGTGARSVDGRTADANGNIDLSAIVYDNYQSLESDQRAIARANINALEEPHQKLIGQFIYWNGSKWAAASVLQVPNGGITDQVLRKQSSGYGWSNVNEIPAGGSSQAVLVKSSNADYNTTWLNSITIEEIDQIVDGLSLPNSSFTTNSSGDLILINTDNNELMSGNGNISDQNE